MQKIKLWQEGETPLFRPEYGQEEPYIVPYLLKNGCTDNACTLVIPGGGYGCVCTDHEGEKICEFLNEQGISAFYLMYRVHPYCHPCMELDAKRAIRYIRFHAADYGIDPGKIGVMGFSAGGHLTDMVSLRFDYGQADGDEIDRVSCRPDTAAPCYAVSSLDPAITHMGTRVNLLGDCASPEIAARFSSENIIPEDAPPFFLFHTAEDTCVNPECSLRFASALIEHHIPVELHIFPFGAHGIGLGTQTPLADCWPGLYVRWLKKMYEEKK